MVYRLACFGGIARASLEKLFLQPIRVSRASSRASSSHQFPGGLLLCYPESPSELRCQAYLTALVHTLVVGSDSLITCDTHHPRARVVVWTEDRPTLHSESRKIVQLFHLLLGTAVAAASVTHPPPPPPFRTRSSITAWASAALSVALRGSWMGPAEALRRTSS